MNRAVLVSNLVSGAIWMGLFALLGALPLSAVAILYVVPASLLLARAYGHPHLEARVELGAWIVAWAAAVVTWALVLSLSGRQDDPLSVGTAVGLGAFLASACLAAWQVLALALRQLAGSRHFVEA